MRGFLVRRPNATPRVFRSDLQLVNPLVEECRFGATLLRRSAFSFSPRPKVGAIFLLITYRYTLFMPNNSTSWGKVAAWYDDLLDGDDTYQKKVILPNLKRLAGIQKGDQVLDLGCGQGFFAREFGMPERLVRAGSQCDASRAARRSAEARGHCATTTTEEAEPIPAARRRLGRAGRPWRRRRR